MAKVKIIYADDIRRTDEKRSALIDEAVKYILEQIKSQFQYPLEICKSSSSLYIQGTKKSKRFWVSDEDNTLFWIHADFKPKERQSLKCGLCEGHLGLKGVILKELNALAKKINVNKIDLFIFPNLSQL